jgi:hypothetical protein
MKLPTCFCGVLLLAPTWDASATLSIIDNGGAGYSTVGWSEQGGVGDAFNSNQGFNSASGNTGASATYTFAGLRPGAQYHVFSTWRQGGQSNVATSVPYTISDGGGVVNVNQNSASGPLGNLITQDTNGSGTTDFRFQHLGTVTEGGNGLISVILGVNSGFSLSDAVAIAEVPTGLTIIDNGGAGYSQTGFTNQIAPNGFNGGLAYNTSPNNGGFATWNFTGLANGAYEVYATSLQSTQGNLSTSAPYTMSDGGGLFGLNQRATPTGDLIVADTNGSGVDFLEFQRIGYVSVLDGDFLVRLDAVAGGGANDFVFADAVAIRLVPEPSKSLLLLSSLLSCGLIRRRKAS